MLRYDKLLIKQWPFTRLDLESRSTGFFMLLFSVNLQDQASTMNFEKENFLRTKFIYRLQQLNRDKQPLWGKMNVQQMIEHFTDVMMVASGKIKLPIVTPADKLPRLQEF